METIIIQPDDRAQAEKVKAFLKAGKIRFETRKDDKSLLKEELREAFQEMKRVKEGKSKARPIEDLLDEL